MIVSYFKFQVWSIVSRAILVHLKINCRPFKGVAMGRVANVAKMVYSTWIQPSMDTCISTEGLPEKKRDVSFNYRIFKFFALTSANLR